MKIFGRNTAASIYGMLFILSIFNFLRLLWSLFSDSDKEWEYFFKCVILLFIGLVLWGAANPEK
ncbi:MAG TPA: hypothetical protein VGB00_10780 [Pyrinomonadaceae bacterium]|jgi:hypothetical protein